MNDFVSMIIPIYNSEKYLAQCLESVIRQTYTNYEVILIDDGSMDGSRKICEKYVDTDKRFAAYYQKNQGASAARNKGLDVARGDIIIFLDSDDLIFPIFLETIVKLFKEGNDIVCFAAVNFKKSISHTEISEVLVDQYTPGQLIENLLYHRQQLSATRSAYKREKYANLRFREEFYICEDILMLLELLVLCTNTISFVKTNLYGYRLHKESLTHHGNWKKKLTGLAAMDNMEDILLKHGIYMEKALINRRMNTLRLIYKSIPWNEKEVRICIWRNIKYNRKTVITDRQSQKKERMAALISMCGQRIYRMFLLFTNIVR